MRALAIHLTVAMFCLPLFAQPVPSARAGRRIAMPNAQTGTAEGAVKQAMEQLTNEKKAYDRDLAVLAHLRTADAALTDPSQPNNAIQKALDAASNAERLEPPLNVSYGVVKARQAIEQAHLSPSSADFERLRGILQREAIGPAARQVAANGAKLHDDINAWLRVQDMINMHLINLANISAESLRAAEQ